MYEITCMRPKTLIGDLDTEVSMLTLFYFTFLKEANAPCLMDNRTAGTAIMSREWKFEARRIILCASTITSTSIILQRDEDPGYVFKRTFQFNMWKYCERSLQKDLYNIPLCSRNRDRLPLVEELSTTARGLLSRSGHKEWHSP